MKANITPTASQTVGPYFHLGCTEQSSVASLVAPETRGDRIRLAFRVLDGDGLPLDDAMIEIWQADAEGKYNHPEDSPAITLDPAFCGFGRLATDEEGVCTFETIVPGPVPANDGLQAAHINVSVFARGILKRLATRVYFDADPALGDDPILALVPAERRPTLLAKEASAGSWMFEIHLCGEKETVFFDV